MLSLLWFYAWAIGLLVVVTSDPITARTPSQLLQPTDPVIVDLCALHAAPAAWNRKRIKVAGFVQQAFEDFTIASECSPTTPATPVWLTYGGRVPSGTIYCCPGEGDTAERPTPLTIDGIVLPLVRDATFERFRKALTRKRPASAHAVLIGTFFVSESAYVSGSGGFGHMGCCSLLVIERVQRFSWRNVP